MKNEHLLHQINELDTENKDLRQQILTKNEELENLRQLNVNLTKSSGKAIEQYRSEIEQLEIDSNHLNELILLLNKYVTNQDLTWEQTTMDTKINRIENWLQTNKKDLSQLRQTKKNLTEAKRVN